MNQAEQQDDGSLLVTAVTIPKEDVVVLQTNGKTCHLSLTYPLCKHKHRSEQRAFICGLKALGGDEE